MGHAIPIYTQEVPNAEVLRRGPCARIMTMRNGLQLLCCHAYIQPTKPADKSTQQPRSLALQPFVFALLRPEFFEYHKRLGGCKLYRQWVLAIRA